MNSVRKRRRELKHDGGEKDRKVGGRGCRRTTGELVGTKKGHVR